MAKGKRRNVTRSHRGSRRQIKQVSGGHKIRKGLGTRRAMWIPAGGKRRTKH